MRPRGFLFLVVVLASFGGSAAAQGSGPRVVGLKLDGVVDPFMSSYITSGIDEANEAGQPVLISIDTPGGYDSSMRDIIKSILNSETPVICYVSPAGARAASAGTFILTACNIAAMAPGTNVGAAHPVGVSGAIMKEKVLNDAVAYIRGLAEARNRNADWLEEAVRDAASVSAEEALELGVIDLMAGDADALFTAIDGETVDLPSGTQTLTTAGAVVEEHNLGFGPSFVHALFTSNLSFILFYAGLILLFIEFLHPGISVPGILGALSLIAALAGFGALPISLLGIVLLLLSVVMFLVELKTPGTGIPAIAGVASLVAGGLFLFDTSVPNVRVSWYAIVPIAGLAVLFFAFVIPASLKLRSTPSKMAQDRLVGREGVVKTAIDPTGIVHVAGEQWRAVSDAGPLPEGTWVKVTGAKGLEIAVEKVEYPEMASQHLRREV